MSLDQVDLVWWILWWIWIYNFRASPIIHRNVFWGQLYHAALLGAGAALLGINLYLILNHGDTNRHRCQ